MDGSPMGRLSAELRNAIYEYTVQTDNPVYLNKFKKGGALTQVCKEIRSEVSMLFFSNTTLVLDFPHVSDWLKAQREKGKDCKGLVAKTLLDVFGLEALRASSQTCIKLFEGGQELNLMVRFNCLHCDPTGALRQALPPAETSSTEAASGAAQLQDDELGRTVHPGACVFCWPIAGGH